MKTFIHFKCNIEKDFNTHVENSQNIISLEAAVNEYIYSYGFQTPTYCILLLMIN